MRATIIVRRIRNNATEKLIEVSSLDEVTVRDTLRELKAKFDEDTFRIDLSQIYWARMAAAGSVAA